MLYTCNNNFTNCLSICIFKYGGNKDIYIPTILSCMILYTNIRLKVDTNCNVYNRKFFKYILVIIQKLFDNLSRVMRKGWKNHYNDSKIIQGIVIF